MLYALCNVALLFTVLAAIVVAPLPKTSQRVMKFAYKNEELRIS